MEHFKVIRQEHLTHYGYLYGGRMLEWIDEFAYITASQEFPGNNFVTKALDNVVFRKSVRLGEIVRFSVDRVHLGNTSVQYAVKAFGTSNHSESDDILFETKITFVAVDADGNKQIIKQG